MGQCVTREQIIHAADLLFYEQGFEPTSFADIAKQVKISRGNFYYHFKSKGEILQAVIEQRMADTRAMCAAWETEQPTAKERIRCYLRILLTNWDKIKHYGCPVGTLSSELMKLNHSSQAQARAIFSVFREWLAQQFILLGCEAEADQLAMQVLAWSQGVATLGQTFQDRALVEHEVARMCTWLDDCQSTVAN